MLQQFLRLLVQRNFKRNSFYTIINILGLSVGLTVFILFTLFLKEISNYDTFHKDYQNIYRVVCQENDNKGYFAGTPAQLGSYLSERIPEIQNYVRFFQVNDVLIKKENESFYESSLLFADNSFFKVFSFEINKGNKVKPIENINSVVISEKMAKKFFGDKDPIGQFLKIGRNQSDYKVTAVVDDATKNSSIKYDFIVSFEIMEKRSYWGMFNYRTFIQLNSTNEFKSVERKIRDCAVERSEDETMQLNFLRLQPLKDMRFELVRGNSFKIIDRKYILIFFFATVFILLLAAINYTNLTTALSLGRYKEVAVKKIYGSQRTRIIIEFLAESVAFAVLALIFAFILVELLRPVFGNIIINEEIKMSYSFIPFFITITIAIGLLAGLYPAFHGSGFQIMALLKRTTKKGGRVSGLRNILVIIQFGITSFLLICAIVFSNQLTYLFNKDLGLQTRNVIDIEVQWPGLKLAEFKNELGQYAGVESVSTGSFLAGKDGWNQSTYWKGMTDEEQINMFVMGVDKDYFKTLNIKFLEKTSDFEDLSFKDGDYFVINKSAKEYIGWNKAVGKEFSINSNSFGQIAAVVDDFNFRSLHHESSPTAILIREEPVTDRMHVRIKPGYLDEVKLFVEKKWTEFAPSGAPLVITNLDQSFKNLYSSEKKTRIIVILFTIIALIISMLGLVGLATFVAAQRTKEIGIRKVLGANNQKVTRMLILGFVKWVFIAFLIFAPLAYLYLNKWLHLFAYHIKIGPVPFVFTAIFIFITAFISVYIQSFRTASKNPVDSLRYE